MGKRVYRVPDPEEVVTLGVVTRKMDKRHKDYESAPEPADFTLSPFDGLFSLEKPVAYAIVLDTETTGLDASIHGLWEIGAILVRMEFGNTNAIVKIEELSCYRGAITPHKTALYDIEAVRYNGYTNCEEMARAAGVLPRGKEGDERVIFSELDAWLSDCQTLVPRDYKASVWAHYATHEEAFLGAWQKRVGLELDKLPSRSLRCTRQMFKTLQFLGVADPEQSASLDALCKYYGLGPKLGNALEDARRTAALLGEMVITLRAACGVYQAVRELESITQGVVSSAAVLSPACSVVEPTHEIMADLRAHARFRPGRSLSYLLCQDLTTKRGEIRLVRKKPDAVSIQAATDERKPLVYNDPKFAPLLLCHYSSRRKLFVVRRQKLNLIPPSMMRLVDILYDYLAEALALVHRETHVGLNLQQMILSGLPDESGISPDAGGVLSVAAKTRLLRQGEKKEKAIANE